MRFETKEDKKPVEPVLVTIHRKWDQHDEDLDLYFNDQLVGYFADGKFWTIAFAKGNPVMVDLAAKGVRFEERENGNGFRIAIET